MAETVGTLNLKIARLEGQLSVIEQQLILGVMYPDHCETLTRQGLRLQSQLDQLYKQRQHLNDQSSTNEFNSLRSKPAITNSSYI